MKAQRFALALALLAVAATGVSAATAGSGPAKGDRAAMRDLRGVNFVSVCRFGHRAPDDPIVFPGQPGKSHDHSFVGNVSTDAFSTVASLQEASTTCRRQGDTAAYWMPTLYVDGSPVAPLGATIYYRRRTLDGVQPFPTGLKMIAGDSHATSPQSLKVTYWNCGAAPGVQPSSAVPACPDGRATSLRLHVNFPSCWDGRDLYSADQGHMAYPTRGRCPSSHPVAVPAISFIFRYPVTGSHDVALSSGTQYSGHADFFNAWNQETLASLADGCLNALRHCGRGV